MCGIAGILSDSIDLRQQNDMVWRVSNSLKMRGPDAHGEYISRNAALIHRRLSVIDPENGKQPMRFGKYIIVYNGEIYNTDEIRRELRFHGYVFETNCDTGCTNVFLAELSKRFPDDIILLVCDGAAWHKSKALKCPENIQLLSIPPIHF